MDDATIQLIVTLAAGPVSMAVILLADWQYKRKRAIRRRYLSSSSVPASKGRAEGR